MELLFASGVSKVSVNSAAVKRPELISEAAREFGSPRVTIAIDARRNPALPSGFELVVAGGTKPTGKDAIAWAKECESLGAGTILPTSMDGDGSLAGYDIPFLRAITSVVSIPVVASGGAGTLEHFYEAVNVGKASILLAASVFHFRTFRICEVKEYLQSRGITVKGSSPMHP